MAAKTATVEHLDVLIVGAGLSGIGAAHHLQTDCPWAELRHLRGPRRHRRHVGPVPLPRHPLRLGHVHARLLVPAVGRREVDRRRRLDPAVHQRHRAESGIDDRIRFHHRITAADWSTADARWHVTAERTDTGETVELTAGFLFSCTGYYRYDHGYLPDFAGMDDFAGTIVHPQAWPEDLDFTGKRIVVIGSGATAVTLVPSLARTAAHVTMLQRSPTYVASVPANSPVAGAAAQGAARRWPARPPVDAGARDPGLLPTEPATSRSSSSGCCGRAWSASCPRATTSTPTSRRATTRGTSGCAPCPTATSSRPSRGRGLGGHRPHRPFTEKGLRLASGDELEADIIVTATGLELLFLGGIALTVDGEAVDPATRLTYKGMMLEGVPNLALAFGYTNASWTLKCDLTCDYVCRLLNHMHERGLTAVHAAQPRRRRRRRARCSGCPRATSSARPTASRSRGRSSPGRCTRATCATTGR